MNCYRLSRIGGLALQIAVAATTLSCHSIRLGAERPVTTALAEPGYGEAIARSRRSLQGLLDQRPGVSVAVVIHGAAVWAEGLGWSDVERHREATADTQYRVYSVAKPITATLIVKLVEEGRLGLDEPISTWIDGLPPALASLTLRELLGHTSGIRHYRKGEWIPVSKQGCSVAREALAPFVGDALEFPPGSRFGYSSYGYVLASAVVESAVEERFHEVLKREILDPAGMAHTVEDSPANESRSGTAFYQSARFGRVERGIPIDNTCKYGAGGLLASARDLARFGGELLEGRLVAAESRDQLFRPVTLRGGKTSGSGYGFGLLDLEGESIPAQSGGAIGGRSFLLLDARRGIVVALASNLEGEQLGDAAVAVRNAFAVVNR